MPHPASPILPDSPHVLESEIVEEGHDCIPHSGPRNQSSGACQSSPFGDSVSTSVSSPCASRGNDYEYVETIAGKTAGSSQSCLENALEVLKFISRSDGAVETPAIEKLFDELSAGGLLHRSKFGQCIGMKELESSSKLFNALARRHIIYTDYIDKTELLKFWDEISDDRFDSRLQIFFDMMNKSTDGRITEEQVEEIIMLSFSEKKYPEIHRNAEEFAMLIKTELDPDNLGYIQIDNLQTLMLDPIQHVSTFMLGSPVSKQFLPSDHAVIRDASSWIKQVSQELRQLGFMRDARASGSESIDQSKSAAAQALKALKSVITTNNAIRWPTVENHFYELSSNGLLHRSKFGDCIGMKELEYAGDLFDALTRRHNICTDFINKAELLEFWDQISDKRFDSRMQIFFDMMDKSADGRITGQEVKELIIISSLVNEMSEIQKNSECADGDVMSWIQKNPEVYTGIIMEELDPNNLGYIEPYNLQMKMMQVRSQPAYIDTANKGSLGETNQSLPQTVELNTLRWRYRVQYLLQDNWKRMWVMLLWLCICSGLFGWKFSQYRRRTMFHVMGYCICVAKGSAETLKFNMALVLLPVCRKTISRIHDRTKIGRVVPLDDNINFHKVISVGIILGAGLHIISHLICGYPRLLPATDAEYEPTKLFFREKRPPNYRWLVMDTEGWTGLLMLVLIAVAFTLATSRFRHGRLRLPGLLKRFVGFNAFWYSHHLFVVVYALLVVHGQCLHLTHDWYKKTTWIYLSIPMFLYTCERFTGVLLSSVQRVNILRITKFPGNMFALRFERPPGFRYKSGQFIFVNCSAASSFEWRPFYITSAPQDDYVSIHIRILGGLAAKSNDMFSTICRPPQGDDLVQIGTRLPKLLIDGPYGTGEQDYKQYDVVLVVGIGDRAAPMISIMKDISNNIKQLDDHADEIESGAVGNGATSFRTRRAYFYWVTWEQGSSDWSRSVIQEVLEADNRDAIELHHHNATGDARSALIAMLRAFEHCKRDDVQRQGDAITCIKTQCTLPRWRAVYKRIALNHVDQRVGVFYSGTPMLGNKLRQFARDFSTNTSTKFEFHTVDTSIS